MSKSGWSRAFDDEIVTPHGRKLVTLRDAAPCRRSCRRCRSGRRLSRR
jgi:hypothetical protein